MATKLFEWEAEQTGLRVCGDAVRLRTEERIQLVDVTEVVAERVRRSGVGYGIASVQTQHTTTAIIVNENEPLLMSDLRQLLERLVPADAVYAHNDWTRRDPRISPDERPNGDAHCRAALLGASVSLNVMGGRLLLGEWQRVFLVELDGPRPRDFSVVVMGTSRDEA